MNKLFTLLGLFCIVTLSAQRHCGSGEKIAQLEQDANFKARHQANKALLSDARSHSKNSVTNTPNSITTIKVVFHVLYKNDVQNITDEQINSQLASMNADFRRMNTDFATVVPQAFQCHASDMEICFVKATVDPNGQPATGITRKLVAPGFDLETQYYTDAGQPAWDTSRYLNIWIGRFQTFGYLGFGTPPAAAGQPYDGLCISYKTVGCDGSAIPPFNKGRTIVHELGHYFGLSHPWGEDGSACGDMTNDDHVGDIPSINDPHFGNPTYPENSNMCQPDENGAMFMNFMDYVNDEAMAFFTDDQKAIVQATLSTARMSLLGTKDLAVEKGISIYPNPADKFVALRSQSASLGYIEIYTANGQLLKTVVTDQKENTIGLENFTQGVYLLRIYGIDGALLKSDKLVKK
ncbi:zinc-dependent metalloprotease [Flavobacterium selenitireducens]|uniref:zinc-dependent metalloprotease n=1 Tax=Flavobacterium selenitireducens TaxID=2722704 RepID=UPI00168BBB12|nr:zinc-dependent metalloprotease [Flavobacterium selenitireducens]MBD3581809.1 T9SS type A sorting domain-containing protein [Flavobacterium selenitireducens]